jgi:prophage regulatory protein
MYAETNLIEVAVSHVEDVRILRFPDVVKKTGMSKSDIYGRIRRNAFPEPVQIGPRSVGFVEREVNHWLHCLVEKSRKAA